MIKNHRKAWKKLAKIVRHKSLPQIAQSRPLTEMSIIMFASFAFTLALPLCSFLLTATIAMHKAQSHGWNDRDDKWHKKEINYHGPLVGLIVCGHHERSIITWIIAWENGSLITIQIGEILTQYGRRITATFNIHQQNCFIWMYDIRHIANGMRCCLH